MLQAKRYERQKNVCLKEPSLSLLLGLLLACLSLLLGVRLFSG